MIKNYIKIGIRNIVKNRGLSLINVGGLALALTVSMFILLWVKHETSYDRFHEKSDRLYQVMNNMKQGNGVIQTWNGSPAPYYRVLQEKLPEVENACMFYHNPFSLAYRNEKYRENGMLTSPSFLEMFDFPLALGKSETALSAPNSIILSATLADIFALLAIIISCLGLLGLAVFNTHRRIKEIGVRKVLGASVVQITGLLSREFILLVIIAFVIGLPFARYLIFNWLNQFSFQVELGWELFALAGIGAVLLALLTVGILGFRAATANPVEALKIE